MTDQNGGGTQSNQPTTTPVQPVSQPQPTQAQDFQQMYQSGGQFKQQVDQFAAGRRGGGPESEPIPTGGASESKSDVVAEVPTTPEIEKKPELSGYVEKADDKDLDVAIIDDYTGQVLLKPVQNKDAVVTLPLTEDQVKDGLHHQVFDAIRWLAEWCVRQIKILHGKVRYKAPPTPTEPAA
jgi:hypothetical protein